MRWCLAFLFLSINFLYSQNINVSGQIKGINFKSLSYVNILAKPLSQDITMAFAITNEQGKYKLVLQREKEYVITISYLGYESFIFKLKATQNLTKNIQLKPATNQLEEVIVIQKIPVVVKQDTIVYNPKVFATGTERKLKQILKKLPGVEVDKKGNVTVLGKKVNKLLVDGKVFFNGGTKLGVENIPANAVDGVEVLDNYNEVAFLKGLTDSDKMAMNIKLKKDKKQFVFGDLEIGTGSEKHYLIHPNLFYYSPKTNVNFIGDLNNTGIKSFTIKEYINFEGGIGKLFTDPSSYFKLSNNDFAQFLENQDFIASQNKFGAFNITQTVTNKIDISTYTIISNTKTDTRNESVNQYVTENTQTIENRVTTGFTDNTFLMAKLALDYVPSTNDDISYAGFIKTSNNKSLSLLNTSTAANSNNLNTIINTNANTIKQNAEWHKKLSRKHTTSLTANYLYDKSNPFSNWITSEPILQNLIPLQNDNLFNINQNEELKLHNLNILFKHYWVLNNNNHIYTTISNNFLSENYITNDFQRLSRGSINNFSSSGFGNDLDFKLNDLSFNIQHKFKVGILTVKYGVALHNYNWKVNQSTKISKNKIVWLPDFLAKLDFNKSEHLNFKYNLRSSFADAPKFANQFQLIRYNVVSRGNENLENELFHSARLWYTKFSLYRGLIMNASIGYTKKVESIRNQIQLQGIDQFSMPFLTDNPETIWNFSTNIRKKLGKFTLKLKGDVNFFEYLQKVNNKNSKNNSDTKSFGIELSTNFKSAPNIEVGFDKSYSKFSSVNAISSFSNENPYINLEYDFLKDFIVSADYSRYTYRNNSNQKDTYKIANASLFYQKEDSAWGFKISGTNILGATFKNKNSFSDFIISDSRTFILPRIWLFTISYKL